MSNIFIGALIFSIWFVALFFGKNIGLSMLIFVIPLTYYLLYILEKNNKIKNKKAKILIIPIALLSSTYFIFNNTFFNILNMLVIPILLIIMLMELLGDKIYTNTIVQNIIEIIFEPLSYIDEVFRKIRDEIRNKLNLKNDSENNGKNKKILKGICITIPIVIVIIVLLASADQVFGNIFIQIIKTIFKVLRNIKISGILIRMIIAICAFLYLSSFLEYIISKYEILDKEEKEKTKNKDNTTIKILLGTLNIVYLLFCIIQIKSLFMRNVNINYAQYARQGFFQLMIVSLINLVTILIARKGENTDNGKENKYINIMCIIMILFTFIILVSSAVRMYFYESAYGYTLLRLLVYCILITESIILIPTIMYIMDKKINLLKVYSIIILIMYICMNFANFDNIIAKRNVDRYIETGKIDMEYLEQTGTDAIPQIMRILETSTDVGNTKAETLRYLKNVYKKLEEKNMDFRDFNISEMFANYLIEKVM